jgi:hypothetical protein
MQTLNRKGAGTVKNRPNGNGVTNEHFAIAEKNGLDRFTVLRRVRDYFWDIERAITEPKIPRNKRWKGIDQGS